MDEGVDSGTVGALVRRVSRYWLLVLAVVAVAAAGALIASDRAETSYVGRTSLIVSSDDRSPEQDAVLVQGYIAYFNNEAYQENLLRNAQVPLDVPLEAEAAASSPILVISATTDDPETAQAYAIAVAGTFVDDINGARAPAEWFTLKAELFAAVTSGVADARTIDDLQSRIDQIEADQGSVLQQLQVYGGVSVQRPSRLLDVVLAVAGGLVLGVLAALAVSAFSRRLHSGLDVADRLGIPILVELPRPRGRAGLARQEQRLGQLATIARARVGGPAVVAVAQPDDGLASFLVARKLAQEWAMSGYPTVLVTTGAPGTQLGEPRRDRERRLVRVLDGADPTLPWVRSLTIPGLSVFELVPRAADDSPAVTVSKLGELLERETLAGRYVVIDAPALVRSAISQAVCQAADQTILVIDTQVTRIRPAREAVTLLRQIGAVVMGAVVATMRRDTSNGAPARPAASGTEDASTERPGSSVNGHPSGSTPQGAGTGRG